MALLERVSTLIRANLNDLVDKAEDPEKMIKQVILDMENQLLQVKTQVAISIADQHVLEKKLAGKRGEASGSGCAARSWRWTRQDDALARSALERSMSYRSMAASFRQQVEDQKTQVENLKTALLKLQQKLAEAQVEERHADRPASPLAGHGQGDRRPARTIGDESHAAAFDRMKNKVQHTEADDPGRGGAAGRQRGRQVRGHGKSRKRSTVCWPS